MKNYTAHSGTYEHPYCLRCLKLRWSRRKSRTVRVAVPARHCSRTNRRARSGHVELAQPKRIERAMVGARRSNWSDVVTSPARGQSMTSLLGTVLWLDQEICNVTLLSRAASTGPRH